MHDLVVARLEAPAKLAPEQIDAQGFAGIRCRGEHGRSPQRERQMPGERIRPAQMPREHGNDETPRLVEHHHCRILLLVAQVRRDEPHHRPERDDGHDRIERGKERRDLLGRLALVTLRPAWSNLLRQFGEFGRREDASAGQRRRHPARQREAVSGDRHHRTFHDGTPCGFLRQPRRNSPRGRPCCRTIISER